MRNMLTSIEIRLSMENERTYFVRKINSQRLQPEPEKR